MAACTDFQLMYYIMPKATSAMFEKCSELIDDKCSGGKIGDINCDIRDAVFSKCESILQR